MAWNTIVAGVSILLLTVAWYGMQIVALRDLRARPSVRGDNKLVWAFVILCVPFLGALGYLSLGPTGFRPRPAPAMPGRRVMPASRPAPERVSPRGQTAAGGTDIAPPTRGTISPQPASRRIPSSAPTGRPYRRLAVDPIIGTDSADLLPTRVTAAHSRRPVPDTIRWPGSAIPQSYHQADADLHQ